MQSATYFRLYLLLHVLDHSPKPTGNPTERSPILPMVKQHPTLVSTFTHVVTPVLAMWAAIFIRYVSHIVIRVSPFCCLRIADMVSVSAVAHL